MRKIKFRKRLEILQSFDGVVEGFFFFVESDNFRLPPFQLRIKNLHHLLSIGVSLLGLYRRGRCLQILFQLVHFEHHVAECGFGRVLSSQRQFLSLNDATLLSQEISGGIFRPVLQNENN